MLHRTFSTAAALTLLAGGTAHAFTTAGPVQQVIAASSYNGSSTQAACPNPTNVQGAVVSITIPSGGDQLVTARFTAGVSATNGQGAIRIVASGRQMLPAGLAVVAFAPTNNPPVALERSIVLAPGTHKVAVQYCVYGDSTNVYDWHLTVEAAPLQ